MQKTSLEKSNIIKALIYAVLISVTIIAILMCICCVVFIASSKIPYDYLEYIMLVFDAVGIYFGGYVAARINKSQGLLLGLATGFIVFLALIISGLCASYDTISIVTLCKALVLLIFGSIGGIKGVNRKDKIHIK